MNKVILYYKFSAVSEVKRFCAEHRRQCRDRGLKGRVYIAEEGINGTLAGSEEMIDSYKDYLRSQTGFDTVAFKEDVCESIPFEKLIVKVRPEIVALRASMDLDIIQEQGRHLTPQEWRQVLESNEDIALIDVRNEYESRIGHFEGAIRPQVENFFDFEKWLEAAKLDKDKKVLMYCTGGIRCEKFSVLMEKKGYKDVYQLEGGIINYAQNEGDAHYKGKCFVFDDRLAVPIEKNQKQPLTKCEITGEPCDRYLNCANMDCNKLFICSEEGAKVYQGCCSEACTRTGKRRPFNPDNIYAPTLKWHHYYGDQPKSKLSPET